MLTTINAILATTIQLIGIYRTAKAAWQAANPGAADPFPTDAELIALLQGDADTFVARADALLAQYRTLAGPDPNS
jgi:hypothetical protein